MNDDQMWVLLGMPITALNFEGDKRMRSLIINALKCEGIYTVFDLVSRHPRTISRIYGFGKKVNATLDAALKAHGLYIGMSLTALIEHRAKAERFNAWFESMDFTGKSAREIARLAYTAGVGE